MPSIESIKECMGPTLMLTLVMGVIAGAISYVVFAIKFLVEDYDTWRECDDSNLWIYVLVSLIISVNKKGASDTSDDNFAVLFCVCMIELGFAIWGSIELFDQVDSCPELRDSDLWSIGLATFIMQLIVGSMVVLIPLVGLIVHYYEKYSDNNIGISTDQAGQVV